MSLDPAVNRRLVERREALGLTQRQLAARMGTQQSAVSDLENGRYEPYISTLTRWAAALGLQVRVRIEDPRDGGAR